MALPAAGSYDSIYDQLVLSEGNKLKAAQLEYGTYNPLTGTYTDGDAVRRLSESYGFGTSANANPYSQRALMDFKQGQEKYDNANQAAAGGNLRSGGYKVRRDALLFGQDASRDALSRQYTESTLGVRKQAFGAQQDYDAALAGGWESALQRKIQNDSIAQQAADRAAETTAAQAAAGGGTMGALPSLVGTSTTKKKKKKKKSNGNPVPVGGGQSETPGL